MSKISLKWCCISDKVLKYWEFDVKFSVDRIKILEHLLEEMLNIKLKSCLWVKIGIYSSGTVEPVKYQGTYMPHLNLASLRRGFLKYEILRLNKKIVLNINEIYSTVPAILRGQFHARDDYTSIWIKLS